LVDQPKTILLYEDVADQRVFFGLQLFLEQQTSLKRFLFHNKDVLLGQQMIDVDLIEA
jgi:hypothetical protein